MSMSMMNALVERDASTVEEHLADLIQLGQDFYPSVPSKAWEAYIESVCERVRAGMAWLDEHRPGWEHDIDLASLNLGSTAMCVLGQVAQAIEPEGRFHSIVYVEWHKSVFNAPASQCVRRLLNATDGLTDWDAIRFGFAVATHDYADEMFEADLMLMPHGEDEESYYTLEVVWRSALAQRQAGQREVVLLDG